MRNNNFHCYLLSFSFITVSHILFSTTCVPHWILSHISHVLKSNFVFCRSNVSYKYFIPHNTDHKADLYPSMSIFSVSQVCIPSSIISPYGNIPLRTPIVMTYYSPSPLVTLNDHIDISRYAKWSQCQCRKFLLTVIYLLLSFVPVCLVGFHRLYRLHCTATEHAPVQPYIPTRSISTTNSLEEFWQQLSIFAGPNCLER